MRIVGVSLDDPKVQEAKRKFEGRQRHSSLEFQLTFEELLELFANDCTTNGEIASLAGCSHQNISRLWKKYFQRLFPHRERRYARRKACILKRRGLLAKERPETKLARAVFDRAVETGLSVRQCLKFKPVLGTFHRKINVEGSTCSLHRSCSFFQPNKNAHPCYSRVEFKGGTLKDVSFVIILQETPRYPRKFFVIPTNILLEIWGSKDIFIYLPLVKVPTYNNIRPKVDWWQYEEAWHLLARKEQ